MAKLNKLYLVKKVPNNRADKRVMQKEVTHINKVILPIFQAYKETYTLASEEERQMANKVYIKECHRVNKNKKFVVANPTCFILNTTSKEEEVLVNSVDSRKKNYAYWIISIVILIVILSFLF